MSDRQAEFERVALPHLEGLLRFARRLAKDPSSARDLVQETFLQAWRAFARLRPDSNVRAWLFRILINVHRGEGRKSRRMPEVPMLSALPEQCAEASVLESLGVLEALDRLPEERRTVLILAVVEGFTAKEISEILSVPAGTVMSRLSRARQAMRNALASEAEHVGR
jgi:RNA polymerase sigma-70 factor (ECF subfamily)